jgi:hypothetical protein
MCWYIKKKYHFNIFLFKNHLPKHTTFSNFIEQIIEKSQMLNFISYTAGLVTQKKKKKLLTHGNESINLKS